MVSSCLPMLVAMILQLVVFLTLWTGLQNVSYYNIAKSYENTKTVYYNVLLLNENATVTICHSKTKDLESITSKADILIVAVGKAKMIKSNFVKENSVVIDVGINFEDGILCGDVDTDDVLDKVSMITPVPFGVGSVTTSILAKQVIKAYKNNI